MFIIVSKDMDCDFIDKHINGVCSENSILIINDSLGKKEIKLNIKNDNKSKYCYIKAADIGCSVENCDYIIIRCNDNRKYLLELKGDGDKNKACAQILSTWEFLKVKFPNICIKLDAIIVTDKCKNPKYNRTKYLILKDRIASCGGNFYDIKSSSPVILH